tara:strand:- start:384 stop:617 length:234 start_codon:yes stop_codon:yes gene_type:complete
MAAKAKKQDEGQDLEKLSKQMSAQNVCNSCKREINTIKYNTRFSCPGCGKQEIVRCGHCRQIAAKYTCSGCKFVGPN